MRALEIAASDARNGEIWGPVSVGVDEQLGSK